MTVDECGRIEWCNHMEKTRVDELKASLIALKVACPRWRMGTQPANRLVAICTLPPENAVREREEKAFTYLHAQRTAHPFPSLFFSLGKVQSLI